MNASALGFAIQLLSTLPQLIMTGQNVTYLIQRSSTALKAMQEEGRDPSDAEWDELNAHIGRLRTELHSPSNPINSYLK